MLASMPDRLLLLGGTGEALALARRLAEAMPDLAVVTSLAGRTIDPVLPPGEVRRGGFGGIDGLVHYLGDEKITLLVNATHPFAATMSAHALAAREATDIALLRLLRPAWRKQPVDSWIRAHDVRAAAAICKWLGRRVLLALGSQELHHFAGVPRAHFVVRMVDAPTAALPLANYEVIAAKGPFSLADERRIILEYGIDLIVAKNSGGDATFAKIAAAREFSIPIVMVDRPEIALRPGCDTVPGVEEALAWIAAHRRQPAGSRGQTVRKPRTGDRNAASGDKA